MYTILGTDGRQYGPVSAEQVRQWIAAGRANGQTLAQAAGTSEWKALAAHAEFTDLAAPAPVPPPLPTVAVAPAGAHGMAVTGLVLGIVAVTVGWICCGPFFSVLGLIFSGIGLSQSGRDPRRQSSRSVAIAGIVLSLLALLISVGVLVLFGLRGVWGHFPRHRCW